MSLGKCRIKASELRQVRTAESFLDPREPELGLGNFVRLNSGGPLMMVVDRDGPIAVFAWRDHAGMISEHSFPVACVHRVSPASADFYRPTE